MTEKKWHIICEKDVGLFSLVQQVIGHIPLALIEGRTPVALFGPRCCYWNEEGYMEANNVWDYYFEPVISNKPASVLSDKILDHISTNPPHFESPGYHLNTEIFVSNHFGNHPLFEGKTLKILYKWKDPDQDLRGKASQIIEHYIRPRSYILRKVDQFDQKYFQINEVIGIHMRATDVADLKTEHNIHRRYSYQPEAYEKAIREALKAHPNASIFIATDSQDALQLMINTFGKKVIHYSSIYHTKGAISGNGPTGWGLPGYLTEDTQKAAQNGEEAVIDYLLLSRCQYLIHNGSGLARTVLLKNPDLPHLNVHTRSAYLLQFLSLKNLEFYYFLKIVTQKKIRSWYQFAKRKFKGASA